MYATALVCICNSFFTNKFNKCIMISMNEIDSMMGFFSRDWFVFGHCVMLHANQQRSAIKSRI